MSTISQILTYERDTTLAERLLSALFAPQLPRVDAIALRGQDDIAEQGSCGTAQPKQYRDALDRFNKTGRV